MRRVTGLLLKVFKRNDYFSGISLEEDFNFNEYKDFEVMQEYLKNQYLMNEPVIIKDSEFRLVKANGLYLPYVNGEKTDLREADLKGAYLWKANLGGAYLKDVKNLELALNLGLATYSKTRVAKEGRGIIEKALGGEDLFVLID